MCTLVVAFEIDGNEAHVLTIPHCFGDSAVDMVVVVEVLVWT
jgi:hypothetical protein